MDNKFAKVILICALVGMLALSAFIFKDHSRSYGVERDVFTEQTLPNKNNKSANKNTSAKTIKVFVTGEVKKPGIYNVPSGQRTEEVIKTAGGFTASAKLEGVNLTKIVRDGMQIKVPALKKNEKNRVLATGDKKQRSRSFKRARVSLDGNGGVLPQGAFVEVVGLPAGKMVCINTATVEELSLLPGVHEELARRIVDRRKLTPYYSREDLLEVRGMRNHIFNKLKDKITL